MLNQRTIIFADESDVIDLPTPETMNTIWTTLRHHGYCLLRDFDTDLKGFSSLINHMCSKVTFDPARATPEKSVQKVDAGTAAIGLHIENGNTPNIPELVGFFCQQAAGLGSQTTLCDGAGLWNALPAEIKDTLTTDMTVTRRLPEALWKAYLVQEHPALDNVESVMPEHLEQMLASMPGQSGDLHTDGSLTYSVDINPLRTSQLGDRLAFANAILGPSFSYEPPQYTLHNRKLIDDDLVQTLRDIAERHTREIEWQDGDIALVDNWRVMHGRREIIDAGNRKLFIGMGAL